MHFLEVACALLQCRVCGWVSMLQGLMRRHLRHSITCIRYMHNT
jgi:hypothetical protein